MGLTRSSKTRQLDALDASFQFVRVYALLIDLFLQPLSLNLLQDISRNNISDMWELQKYGIPKSVACVVLEMRQRYA